jgi:hypothetical protein
MGSVVVPCSQPLKIRQINLVSTEPFYAKATRQGKSGTERGKSDATALYHCCHCDPGSAQLDFAKRQRQSRNEPDPIPALQTLGILVAPMVAFTWSKVNDSLKSLFRSKFAPQRIDRRTLPPNAEIEGPQAGTGTEDSIEYPPVSSFIRPGVLRIAYENTRTAGRQDPHPCNGYFRRFIAPTL